MSVIGNDHLQKDLLICCQLNTEATAIDGYISSLIQKFEKKKKHNVIFELKTQNWISTVSV